MKEKITVTHIEVALKSDFLTFTKNLEVHVLKKLEDTWIETLARSVSAFHAYLQEIVEPTGLVLFGVQDHGRLREIVTGKAGKAKQYSIGNPFTAISMTEIDLRTGLYAPLRLYVYEEEGKGAFAQYDLPSSQFGQWENQKVIDVAMSLDRKIKQLIELADLQIGK